MRGIKSKEEGLYKVTLKPNMHPKESSALVVGTENKPRKCVAF